jgi:hypothetical protein
VPETLAPLPTLVGHVSVLRQLALSRDGHRLMSAGAYGSFGPHDGTTRVDCLP